MHNYKTSRENIGENLCDLWFGDEFLEITLKVLPLKENNIGNLNITKVKSLLCKDTITRIRRRHITVWENIFINHVI
jgi:hypothetical protein